MARRHMWRPPGGGGGGGDGIDATFPDTVELSSGLTLDFDRPDSVDLADALATITSTLQDTADLSSMIPAVALSVPTAVDTVLLSAFYTFDLTMGASEDCYLDRADAAAAHDGSTMLCKVNTPVINDDKKAYIAFDLTGIVGVTQGGDGAGHVTLRVSHNVAAVAQALTWEAYRSAAKPFEEDTATWTGSEPVGGTGMTESNTPVSVTAGAAADYVFNVTNIEDAFGQWLLIRLLGSAAVGGDLATFTIVSREGANPPRLNFDGDQ